MADSNISVKIITALNQIFEAELKTAYPVSDKLRLRRLDYAPLQDDPTKVAPYLVHGPVIDLGEMPNEDLTEVGGSTAWFLPWRATCGIPRQSNKLAAYSAIGTLASRVKHCVLKHHDLGNILASGPLISDDGLQVIDGSNPLTMWLGTRQRIYGGQNEFYGEALMYWTYVYRDHMQVV